MGGSNVDLKTFLSWPSVSGGSLVMSLLSWTFITVVITCFCKANGNTLTFVLTLVLYLLCDVVLCVSIPTTLLLLNVPYPKRSCIVMLF